jgi:hypothetical protein
MDRTVGTTVHRLGESTHLPLPQLSLESIQPGRCILSTELLQVFNAWLATNGHLPWSKETFGPRFKQHDETTKHGVRLAKISKLESLSRPPWLLADRARLGHDPGGQLRRCGRRPGSVAGSLPALPHFRIVPDPVRVGRERRDGGISREGSVALRRALIDLGIGLWHADPAARRYGQQLRARGKRGGVIGCAMANRANRIAYALVRDQTGYDPDRWA